MSSAKSKGVAEAPAPRFRDSYDIMYGTEGYQAWRKKVEEMDVSNMTLETSGPVSASNSPIKAFETMELKVKAVLDNTRARYETQPPDAASKSNGYCMTSQTGELSAKEKWILRVNRKLMEMENMKKSLNGQRQWPNWSGVFQTGQGFDSMHNIWETRTTLGNNFDRSDSFSGAARTISDFQMTPMETESNHLDMEVDNELDGKFQMRRARWGYQQDGYQMATTDVNLSLDDVIEKRNITCPQKKSGNQDHDRQEEKSEIVQREYQGKFAKTIS